MTQATPTLSDPRVNMAHERTGLSRFRTQLALDRTTLALGERDVDHGQLWRWSGRVLPFPARTGADYGDHPAARRRNPVRRCADRAGDQHYVRLPFPDLPGRRVRLKDLMGSASDDRDGSDLPARGLYLDLPPWSYHVFEVAYTVTNSGHDLRHLLGSRKAGHRT